jgi:hypothetical protein
MKMTNSKKLVFEQFPPGSKKMVEQVDEYITNNSAFLVFEPNAKMGIAYKRTGRRGGFAKLCTGRKCLILRYGTAGDKNGLEVQNRINSLLGKEYPRMKTDGSKYPHEAFIKLEWVNNINDITKFIDEAYQLRP